MQLDITEVEQTEVLAEDRAIRIECQDSQGTTHTIKIAYEAITPFFAALASLPLNEAGQAGDAPVHPLKPVGVRAFQLATGEIGLSFLIADQVAVPIVFPKAAIAALRQHLDELEKL